MKTECTQKSFDFHPLFRRDVVARFNGGQITSDAGGLLLRETEQATRILSQFAKCFTDHRDAPERIVIDLDATDDPLHGKQPGCFFHGYYKHYSYLPLYIFCGEHLLAARLRPSNIDDSAGSLKEIDRNVREVRQRWPNTTIVIGADSGFCQEPIMAWCEEHRWTTCLDWQKIIV